MEEALPDPYLRLNWMKIGERQGGSFEFLPFGDALRHDTTMIPVVFACCSCFVLSRFEGEVDEKAQ